MSPIYTACLYEVPRPQNCPKFIEDEETLSDVPVTNICGNVTNVAIVPIEVATSDVKNTDALSVRAATELISMRSDSGVELFEGTTTVGPVLLRKNSVC